MPFGKNLMISTRVRARVPPLPPIVGAYRTSRALLQRGALLVGGRHGGIWVGPIVVDNTRSSEQPAVHDLL